MALRRDVTYSGRFTPATTERPQGGFKNRTSPTSEDGSYLEEQWLNDIDGFFGSLLNATNTTPNGNVDEAGNSQLFNAATQLFSQDWSANVNYDIGREVVRNNLRYIARAASGPDNGGAITPESDSGLKWDAVLPAAYSIKSDTIDEWIKIAVIDGNETTPGDFLSIDVAGGSGRPDIVKFSAEVIVSERGDTIKTIVTPKTIAPSGNPEFYTKRISFSLYELWIRITTPFPTPVTIIRKSQSRNVSTVSGILETSSTAPTDTTLVPYDTGYQFASIPIGMEVAFDTPPPTNDPRFRFVKLTYNDAYNTGLLTSQTLSGSAPELVSTAVISAAQSPINGQTIDMINTMGTFIRPGVTAGVRKSSQNKAHTHSEYGAGQAEQVGGGGIAVLRFATGNTGVSGGDEANPYCLSRVFYKRIY